jgi:hypothetical protein
VPHCETAEKRGSSGKSVGNLRVSALGLSEETVKLAAGGIERTLLVFPAVVDQRTAVLMDHGSNKLCPRDSPGRKPSSNWSISEREPAQSRHITIAIEPQRREESNIINTTAEALAWVQAVNHPNIQLMIDYYHFEVEKENPAMIPKVRDHLCHLHMANPNNLVMPLNPEEYNYAPFFAVLRQIRYDGLIGLEASSNNLPVEGPRSIALLRRALEQ